MPHDTLLQPDLRSGNEDMHVGEGSLMTFKSRRAGGLVRGGSAVMSGEWTGWERRRKSGPGDAGQAALLLPGGMCTAVQYEELMAKQALAGVRMVAVTVPGMGGTPAPKDLSIENLACLAAQCAADLGLRRCGGVQHGREHRAGNGGVGRVLRATGAVRAELLAPGWGGGLPPLQGPAGPGAGAPAIRRVAENDGPRDETELLEIPDRREVLAAEFRRGTRASYGAEFAVIFSAWTGTGPSRRGSARPTWQPG